MNKLYNFIIDLFGVKSSRKVLIIIDFIILNIIIFTVVQMYFRSIGYEYGHFISMEYFIVCAIISNVIFGLFIKIFNWRITDMTKDVEKVDNKNINRISDKYGYLKTFRSICPIAIVASIILYIYHTMGVFENLDQLGSVGDVVRNEILKLFVYITILEIFSLMVIFAIMKIIDLLFEIVDVISNSSDVGK